MAGTTNCVQLDKQSIYSCQALISWKTIFHTQRYLPSLSQNNSLYSTVRSTPKDHMTSPDRLRNSFSHKNSRLGSPNNFLFIFRPASWPISSWSGRNHNIARERRLISVCLSAFFKSREHRSEEIGETRRARKREKGIINKININLLLLCIANENGERFIKQNENNDGLQSKLKQFEQTTERHCEWHYRCNVLSNPPRPAEHAPVRPKL